MKHSYFTCDKCGKSLPHFLFCADFPLVAEVLKKPGQTSIDLCEDCHISLVVKLKQWASENHERNK